MPKNIFNLQPLGFEPSNLSWDLFTGLLRHTVGVRVVGEPGRAHSSLDAKTHQEGKDHEGKLSARFSSLNFDPQIFEIEKYCCNTITCYKLIYLQLTVHRFRMHMIYIDSYKMHQNATNLFAGNLKFWLPTPIQAETFTFFIKAS